MNLKNTAWVPLSALLATAIACSATDAEDDAANLESAFSQSVVDADPTLKALQEAAADVHQYEIRVDEIDVPVPNASVGAQANGFSTRGLDWFRNPNVVYPDNKSWDQGTDTGKKCQWAAVFRFHAIFSDPPAEAIAMRDLEGGLWNGAFWSWIDDYASTDSIGRPTPSYAWSSGLWKWIGASGKDGLCRLPTKTMVARMMSACLAHANANAGDPKDCRMPPYDPSFEPAEDAGAPSEDAGALSDAEAPGEDAGAPSDADASDELVDGG